MLDAACVDGRGDSTTLKCKEVWSIVAQSATTHRTLPFAVLEEWPATSMTPGRLQRGIRTAYSLELTCSGATVCLDMV